MAPRGGRRRFHRIFFTAVALLLISLLGIIWCFLVYMLKGKLAFAAAVAHAFDPVYGLKGSGSGPKLAFLPDYVEQNLGQYSPYFPAAEYVEGPTGCSLSKVNLLYRHGARFPTSGSGNQLKATLAKLKVAEGQYTDPKLQFLNNYTYTFGTSDLVPYGAQQASEAGREVYKRYGHLLQSSSHNATKAPFVRASDSQRVIETAANWTASLELSSSGMISITAPLRISEAPESNNTLDDNQCPSLDESVPDDAQALYLMTFAPPITRRLNAWAPGANLSDSDTINVFYLCGFDSVVKEETSSFCKLFTATEFIDFEYYQDLGKYYLGGYGNPLGPVQGVGYVNELIARLTSKPVKLTTNINRTLATDPSTFPLDRPLYADFSHDNQIGPIVSALGLHKPLKDLSTDRRVEQQPWVFSKIAPFTGRLAVELYTCLAYEHGAGSKKSQWVRILNDDAVLDQPLCERKREGGLCELGAFVRSQKFSTDDAVEDLWARCLGV